MFRIGQKVVCVDAEGTRNFNLIKGEIYTIANIVICACQSPCIFIKEAETIVPKWHCECERRHPGTGYKPFKAHRFRPIDEAFGENVAAAFEEQFAFETTDRRTEITA